MMASKHIVAADYVRGALSPSEFRAAEAHLEQCEQCRAAVAAVRQAHPGERRVGALVSFLAHMLRGSASLLAAPLRALPQRREPVKEEAVPPVTFEPLRVLTPRSP